MKKLFLLLAIVAIVVNVNAQDFALAEKRIQVIKVGVAESWHHLTNRSKFTRMGSTLPETMDVQVATISLASRPSDYWLSDPGDAGFEYGVIGKIGGSQHKGGNKFFFQTKPYLMLLTTPFSKFKFGYEIGIPINLTSNTVMVAGQPYGVAPLSVEIGGFFQYGRLSALCSFNVHETFEVAVSFDLW